jgi:hypothetical protein
MSVTRRTFIHTGTVAAAVTLADASSLLAATEDLSPQALPAGVPADVLADPLWGIPRTAWARHVGTIFTLYGPDGRQAGSLVLERVTDLRAQQQPKPAAGQECFSLLFKNRRRKTLPQEVYTVEHGVLGRVELLLVPVVSRKNPLTAVEAIINRVAPLER